MSSETQASIHKPLRCELNNVLFHAHFKSTIVRSSRKNEKQLGSSNNYSVRLV
jgi:hypothetical protein